MNDHGNCHTNGRCARDLGATSRSRTYNCEPGFNRWLVPPAALAIHLCIGMAYGFSVFWLPLSRLVPNADAAACANITFWAELFTTSCNWTVPRVTPMFEVFIAVLGIPAAIWGGLLEHAGPRKAGSPPSAGGAGSCLLGLRFLSTSSGWFISSRSYVESDRGSDTSPLSRLLSNGFLTAGRWQLDWRLWDTAAAR